MIFWRELFPSFSFAHNPDQINWALNLEKNDSIYYSRWILTNHLWIDSLKWVLTLCTLLEFVQSFRHLPRYYLLWAYFFSGYSGDPNTGHSKNWTIQIADNFSSSHQMSVIWMAVRYSDAIWIADHYSNHHSNSRQFFVRYSDVTWIPDHSTIGLEPFEYRTSL